MARNAASHRMDARVAAIAPQQHRALTKILCREVAANVATNAMVRRCVALAFGSDFDGDQLLSVYMADPLQLIDQLALVDPHGWSVHRQGASTSRRVWHKWMDRLYEMVDEYLRRVRPLPSWATAVLITPDVSQVIFGHFDAALALSRASCVCRTWARDELSQPVWRRLVMHQWPDESMMLACWSVDTCMRRKYRRLSQGSVNDLGTQRQNERARSQIKAEYVFRCIMMDPQTDEALAEWESEIDMESGTPAEGGFELQPLHAIGGLVPSRFCGMDDDDGAWLPCGVVNVRVFARRVSDGCVTQFATFDVDLARDASDTLEWDVNTQQHWLTGCTHSIRLPSLLQTRLGMPEDSQTQHSCVRVETLEGGRDVDAEHDMGAPSPWRLNDFAFSFYSSQGSYRKAAEDSLKNIGEESATGPVRSDMWCSEVLAILQMSEWV